MKKILNYILIGTLVAFTYNCEDESVDDASVNYVTFDQDSRDETVGVGEGSKTIDINVYTGNISGSERTLQLTTEGSTADPSAYTVPSSVTIPGGSNVGTIPVVLNEAGLDFVLASVVIAMVEDGSIAIGSSTEINAGLSCPTDTAGQLTIEVTTDNWPDETSWELTDASGAVMASGGPYNNPADDFTTIVTNVTVGAGSYTMTLFDSYGDGGSSFEIFNGCDQLIASEAVTGSSVTDSFVIE